MKKMNYFCGVALLLAIFTGCSHPIKQLHNERDEQAIIGLMEAIENAVNAGELETFMELFTEDAVIMGEASADVIGKDNITALYSGAMAQFDLWVDFSTKEIKVFGDLAYEMGTYKLRVLEKDSGAVLDESESRHLHIFQRQENGDWKTWRMFVNSFEP